MWFIIALCSVFFLAATELYQKYSLSSKKDFPILFNNFFVSIVMSVTSFVIGGIWLLFSKQSIDLSQWPLMLLNGVVFFLGCTIFYSSYKGISSSLGTLLCSVSVLVSTSWGILVLGESVTWQKFVGIFLVLFAIILVNLTTGKAKLKYVIMALVGGVLFGITYALDKTILVESTLNPMIYLGMLTVITGVLNVVFGYSEISQELKTFTKKDFYPMFMVGLFGAIFNLLSYAAYSFQGEVGKVDAINSAVCFVILAGEIIFLKDRSNILRKVISIVIALVGIGLLA